MAEIKGYPNNRDEYVGAETLMKWLHGRTSGVFAADSSLSVTAVQNKMEVAVSDGYGWLTDAEKNGIVFWVDTKKSTGEIHTLAISAADSTLSRIDRVIIEWTTTNYTENPVLKILEGSKSSNPTPPALTNNSTTRQLSLARVSVPAGTTSIVNSLITDERLDASVCGIVTDRVEVDTSMIQNQVSAVLNETQAQTAALLQAIEDELADLEAGTAVELKKLLFTDVTVPISGFVANPTYQDYGYRAAVGLDGVISSMIPEVVLSMEDAIGGNFAPVVETYNGGVYIYAASPPESAVTIPTIICWRGA